MLALLCARGVEAVPIADVRTLQVVFPVSFAVASHCVGCLDAPQAPQGMTLESWRWYNPSSHVGALLGHEGPLSLTALLRKKGWVTELEVGGADNTSTFAVLVVAMELTKEGLRRQEEVLRILFGYLNFLRGLKDFPEEALLENLQLSQCAWVTREEPGPQEAAVQLAGSMQDWAFPRDYVAGNSRLRDGPGLRGTVKALLRLLQPSDALVTAGDQAEKLF